MLLYDEGATDDNPSSSSPPDDFQVDAQTQAPIRSINKLKLKSCQFLDPFTCPSIWAFLYQSISDLKKQTWQEIPSNLSSRHQKALKSLKKLTNVI